MALKVSGGTIAVLGASAVGLVVRDCFGFVRVVGGFVLEWYVFIFGTVFNWIPW